MSTEKFEDSNQSETAQLTFPGKYHLTEAVIENSLRYYIGEFGVFILFLLRDGDNISVCYGRGEVGKDPMGQRFERLITLTNIEDALKALETMQARASEHLKPTATDTNT